MLILLLLKISKEVSLVRKLSHEIDPGGVGEEPVELQDVGMVVASVKLYLSLHLLLQALLYQKLFVHGFDGYVDTCMALTIPDFFSRATNTSENFPSPREAPS